LPYSTFYTFFLFVSSHSFFFSLTKLSSIYFSTSIFACRALRISISLYFLFSFCKLTPSRTHTHAMRELVRVVVVVFPARCFCCYVYLAVKLRLLLVFQHFPLAAAAAAADSFSSFINAGSVKIYSRKKGKSSQMENYGCTRAHAHMHKCHPLTHNNSIHFPTPRTRSRLSFQVVLFNFEASKIQQK